MAPVQMAIRFPYPGVCTRSKGAQIRIACLERADPAPRNRSNILNGVAKQDDKSPCPTVA
jgi:hypothetical protein